MLTAKAKKLHKPRPVGRKLLGGLESSPEIRPSLQLGGKSLKLPKLLAIDTETTGVDLYHGCKPFFVSICDADGNLMFWEWDVNPLTRNVGHALQSPLPTSRVKFRNGVDADGCPPAEDSPFGVFVTLPPKKELAELAELIKGNKFVLHNTKFDAHGLESHGLPRIDLATVHDTLIASHVLCSNESHGLKDLALIYCDIRDDDQKELRDATNEARRIARQLDWQVAEGPHIHFPSQKQAPSDGWWIMDTWLPRMVAKYKWEVEGDQDYAPPGVLPGYKPEGRWDGVEADGHPWWTVLRRYALRDVERTYGLYWIFMEELENQRLMEQYEQRRQNIAAIYEMERNGVSVNSDRLEATSEKLLQEMEEMAEQCFKIAAKAPPPPKPDFDDVEFAEMTKKQRKKAMAPFVFDNLNSPKQLETLLFDCFKLKTTKRTQGGARSTDAEVLAGLKERAKGPAKKFVETLTAFRKRDKALAYINEYRLRGVDSSSLSPELRAELDLPEGILVLRGNFNITGTDTTRFSSSGPNFQNISKKEYEEEPGVVIKDLNLRRMFGPAPGREWYSGDYSNIELRIFAWKSGDQNLIQAFLDGYSVHLLFAELLYPEQWEVCRKKATAQLATTQLKGKGYTGEVYAKELRNLTGDLFKVDYESSWYQWVKNGDFALIYGAGEAKADRTYHRPGAYALIRNRMPEIDNFLSQKFHEAEVHSFVTTLGGYKLYVPTTEPHKAVNYFVQGSAGWFMCTAINRIHKYLTDLNRKLFYGPPYRADRNSYKMIMTIHDELVFDFPKHPRNLEVITQVAKLMEQSGKPFGIPTPVQFDLHEDNWADGKKLKLAA